MQSQRQTASFLMQRFQDAGIRPDTRHGQNFLVDLNLLHLLADSAKIGPRDVVLEIGTGTGSLTGVLAGRAAAVVSIEIDGRLQQLASEELIAFANVTLLRQDALKNKNHFRPNVIETVQQLLDAQSEANPDSVGSGHSNAQPEVPPGGRGTRGLIRPHFKLVSNLPYNIATPVVTNLLATELVPESMTVTIQKELAERMAAKPQTKDYGALSIWIQSQCTMEIIRVMPPTVFWPRPKVESAIIQIIPREELRRRIPDLDFFHTFVRAMFFHRRKFLRREVHSAFKEQLDKPAVDSILDGLELGPTSRAEELSIETMLALCEAVRARVQ